MFIDHFTPSIGTDDKNSKQNTGFIIHTLLISPTSTLTPTYIPPGALPIAQDPVLQGTPLN